MFSLISLSYKKKRTTLSQKILNLDDGIEIFWKQSSQVKFSKKIFIYSMYFKPIYTYSID